jgi:hypothetical protein
MEKQQLSIFGTKNDFKALLEAVGEQSLHFLQTGLFDSPQITPINSLLTIADFGLVSVGDTNQTKAYLVVGRDTPFNIRTVPQQQDNIKYAIDQLANPKTIMFRPGGVFEEKCLIAGQIGTISEDTTSLELFRRFKEAVQHQFTKIKSFYVGKEAEEMLGKGWRLTSNVKASTLYDLKRD